MLLIDIIIGFIIDNTMFLLSKQNGRIIMSLQIRITRRMIEKTVSEIVYYLQKNRTRQINKILCLSTSELQINAKISSTWLQQRFVRILTARSGAARQWVVSHIWINSRITVLIVFFLSELLPVYHCWLLILAQHQGHIELFWCI